MLCNGLYYGRRPKRLHKIVLFFVAVADGYGYGTYIHNIIIIYGLSGKDNLLRREVEMEVRQTERRQRVRGTDCVCVCCIREKERESEREGHTLLYRQDDDSPYEPPRYTFTIVDEPIALVGHNVAP